MLERAVVLLLRVVPVFLAAVLLAAVVPVFLVDALLLLLAPVPVFLVVVAMWVCVFSSFFLLNHARHASFRAWAQLSYVLACRVSSE